MEYALSQNYWNFIRLFTSNENDLVKKHKNQKINSSSGAEFCLTPEGMQTSSSTLNNISETSS